MKGVDVRELRRARLTEAVEGLGGTSSLAQAMGVTPSYLRNLLSATRNVGHRTARNVERVMGWPEGYMDAADADISADLQALMASMPESDLVKALAEVVPDLSAEGAAALAQALLQRTAANAKES